MVTIRGDLFRKLFSHVRVRWHSSEGMMPTTLTKMNMMEEKAPLISAYSVQGFTIRGTNRVIGSVALLPKGFFHWKVSDPKDITPESLTLFTLIHPQLGVWVYIIVKFFLFILELVVIGTGTKMVPMETSVRRYLQSKGISVEVQDTVSLQLHGFNS